MFKIFTLIVLQFLTLLLPPMLLAHETESDSGIGAILHVDPNDSPVEGQESTLFFEFTDMEEKLNLVDCECVIVIMRGDQEVLRESFSAEGNSSTSGVVDFIFPESDIYKAIVTGKPKLEGQFQAFNLTFPVRVEQSGPKTITEAHNLPHNTLQDHVLHYLPTGLIILALVLILGFVKGKRKFTLILLAGVIVFHSVPVKAIHASHQGTLEHEGFACCLPVNAVVPESSELEVDLEYRETQPSLPVAIIKPTLNPFFFIRPPPFS